MNPPIAKTERRPARRCAALSRRTQRGIGLIEVLIAVLILALGILGIAAVQTQALANNNSSMGRTMATVESYSILDAMRVDRVNALAGSYNTTVVANACPSGTSLADTQLNTWCNDLGQYLGAVASTSGQIACQVSGDCTITITFDDSRSGAGGSAAQTVVTQAGL